MCMGGLGGASVRMRPPGVDKTIKDLSVYMCWGRWFVGRNGRRVGRQRWGFVEHREDSLRQVDPCVQSPRG